MNTVYAVLPALRARRGRLGIVGSVSGWLSSPGTAAYTASKHAVVGLAESLYYELAPAGVSVTCINPGFIASEIRSVNKEGVYTGKPDPVPAFLVAPASAAAHAIVHALYKRRPEVIITAHGKLLIFLARHCPRTTRFLIRRLAKSS